MARWGGIYTHNSVAVQAVTTTPAVLTLWDSEYDGAGIDADYANGRLTVRDVQGDYFLNFNASIDGEDGATYVFEIRRNGLGIPLGAIVEMPATGHIQHVSIIGAYRMYPTNYLTVHVWADSSRNLTMRYGQFGIMSI